MIRIALIPVFTFFLLTQMQLGTLQLFSVEFKITSLVSVFIFIIASLTDWIDGYIARKHQLITNLGKFLDPLADKLLVTAAFIALVQLNLAPAWIVILILSREIAITGFRVVAASKGIVIAAGNSGKIKTTMQLVTIILLIFNIHPTLNSIFLTLTTFITIYSGIEYFVKNKTVFSE